MKIVLASSNPGKIRELADLLKNFNIDIVLQSELGIPDADETGLTFIENALIKARHAARLSGLPAIADDSGLAVNALSGAPGIYSARFAGTNAKAEDNIKKLLADLQTIPDENREAAFHCALVFMSHEKDPTPLISQGRWSGMILNAPKGNSGFGYDPIFYIPSLQKTAAELDLTLKNKISHRALALQSLIKSLPEKLHECARS